MLTSEVDRSPSEHYQFGSTYTALNRNRGRVALQQQTKQFHVTTPYSRVDGKATILLEGGMRKRVRWSDVRNKRCIACDVSRPMSGDRPITSKAISMSTYITLSRNSGRITLQQETNHFRVTITCSKVDGKQTILLRGGNDINEPQK